MQSNIQFWIGGKQFFSSSQVEGSRASAKSKKSNSHNNNSEHSTEVKLIQSQNLKLSGIPKSHKRAESHSNASERMQKSKTMKVQNDDTPLDLAEELEEDKEEPVPKTTSDTAERQAINRTEGMKTQE